MASYITPFKARKRTHDEANATIKLTQRNVIPISDAVFLVILVRDNGVVYASLRRYESGQDPDFSVTPEKSVTLTLNRICRLVDFGSAVTQAIREENSVSYHVGNDIHLNYDSDRRLIHLRMYAYSFRLGKLIPTKRGVCLTENQYNSFMSIDWTKEMHELNAFKPCFSEHSDETSPEFKKCAECMPPHLRQLL